MYYLIRQGGARPGKLRVCEYTELRRISVRRSGFLVCLYACTSYGMHLGPDLGVAYMKARMIESVQRCPLPGKTEG